MFLTGFADEAGPGLATQIKAIKTLGWDFIELRNVDGKNLATFDEAEFTYLQEALAEANLSINCFGSPVANWSRHPRSEEDFQKDLSDLASALPRMQKLGIKLIRGMSYVPANNEEPDNPELEKIIFGKIKELVQRCADAGIVYGHENCRNYGGLSWQHTLKLLEAVNHDNLKLIFDTGNPVFTLRHIGKPPYPTQSAWEFYSKVKEHIIYVHIKDCTAHIDEKGTPVPAFCFAGDGEGDVRAILIDLFRNGYDGGFSIEPHVATVFHADDNPEDSVVQRKRRFDTFVSYGKEFEQLVKQCQAKAKR
ncbi:MAG: sugar phosphate isomerase/epimerase [Oligosphaeraceae bacterium]|nr:sugar phosphate isomerase/epimerase [Oligosphaeraceae bacterium]